MFFDPGMALSIERDLLITYAASWIPPTSPEPGSDLVRPRGGETRTGTGAQGLGMIRKKSVHCGERRCIASVSRALGGRVEGSWRAMRSSGVGTRVGGHRYGLVGARDSLSTLTGVATRLMHVPSHAPHWNPVPCRALLMPEGVWTLLVPQGKCNHPLRGYVDR